MKAADLLTKPELLETDDCSDACPDCPRINPKPPRESDCPNFDDSYQPPVCVDESSIDGLERQFSSSSQHQPLPRLVINEALGGQE